jgi:hypothetical protein
MPEGMAARAQARNAALELLAVLPLFSSFSYYPSAELQHVLRFSRQYLACPGVLRLA